MGRVFKPSPLALEILALLHEAPMHPYRMQRLIKERGKDQVIRVEQRASLYQTINQLLAAGLIAVWETERPEKYPERTIYKLTDLGHDTALRWLRQMLSTPDRDFPEFPAAVSLLPLLRPEDALQQLEEREAKLLARRMELDDEIKSNSGSLPRLFLLEVEYQHEVLAAELSWVRRIAADLRSGALDWPENWAHPSGPPQIEE